MENAAHIPAEVKAKLEQYAAGHPYRATLSALFRTLTEFCRQSDKKIVLLIDEIDTATNNQVFIDFLAQLRAYYLKRRRMPVFQSVILAGVYDVRNISRKIRPEEDHKENSPWNIAADFLVEMNFSVKDIEGMLSAYENDRHTGMDVSGIAGAFCLIIRQVILIWYHGSASSWTNGLCVMPGQKRDLWRH